MREMLTVQQRLEELAVGLGSLEHQLMASNCKEVCRMLNVDRRRCNTMVLSLVIDQHGSRSVLAMRQIRRKSGDCYWEATPP